MSAKPQPSDDTTKGPAFADLSAAMIGAHAAAKAVPGKWERREAGYLRSLAWRTEGERHTVVLQSALTPSLTDLTWFLMALPERLRPVEVKWRYDKHQLWFTLEPSPIPESAPPRPDMKVVPPARVEV